MELAGVESQPIAIAEWPGASRSRDQIEERALAAACEQVDIVIAPRWLPASCRPARLNADGRLLEETAGLAFYFDHERIDTVNSRQGEHGWWQAGER